MSSVVSRVIVIGPGRLGRALSAALARVGYEVVGPLARHDARPSFSSHDIVLLCVPDDQIANVATTISSGPLVAHCAGALSLDVLGERDAFSLHPLLSVTGDRTSFAGAACAIAATSEAALSVARDIAARLEMDAIVVRDEDRSLYHAAASMASNYLVTIETAADRLAATVGVERRHLARLAQSALENWTRLGEAALTGPIARGDEATVQRQRDAVIRAAPDLVDLWDTLARSTRGMAKAR
jgi:predicted short-subunit dehydrogenase-like oxidoreductase (DUF2520 family)